MNFSDLNAFDSSALHTRNADQEQIFLWGAVGLAPRQELVLKSMMRLIDHKLDHKWFYNTTTMDLCMNAADSPGVVVPAFQDATGRPAHVLTLGVEKKGKGDFLSLPLYASELLHTVNRIGHVIQPKKYAAGKVSHANVSVSLNALLRLKRWPPAHLLGKPEHIRMATLLTGRSLVLQELQRRAGYPLAACEAFIKDLFQAGLLEPAQVLQQATLTNMQPVAAKKSTVSASIKPGLLDKIRMRLGLGMRAQQ